MNVFKLPSTLIFSACLLFNVSCTKQENKSSVSSDDQKQLKKGNISSQNEIYLFIGSYTTNIFIYTMNTETGALTYVAKSPNTSNPSYLTIHPNGKWLYCVNESSPGKVSAFVIDTTNKKLTLLNSVDSKGNSPCFISINKSGSYAMVANYSSGSFALFKINSNGSLSNAVSVIQDKGKGPNTSRQEGPHAHMIAQNPQNCMVYATDLGTDQVQIFNIDSINNKFVFGAITAKSASGAGPRHFAVHPEKPWVYILHELKGIIEASNVNAANGEFEKFQTISTIPENTTGNPGSADIHFTNDGKFLYATNRGDFNSIAMFTIDQTTGILKSIGYQSSKGKTPRNFVIDPTGMFLLVANQEGNNIVTFKIDPATGVLQETDYITNVSSPVCLKFLK
jgi:6-phosphogluconolactonase